VALAEPRLRARRRRREVLTMRRAGLLLALVTLAVLGSVRVALACSCIQSGPACQAFWNTTLVFDAVARSVDDERGLATIDVRHVWKGTVPDNIVVPSGDGASCVYQFEAGRRYLVFASHDPSNGRVRVSVCSATHIWDGSGRDADFLASLSRPATGGQVFGTVRHFTRSGGGIPDKDEIPIVTSVHLQTPAGVQSMKSDGGEFHFLGLTPGAYVLSIDTPAGDIADRPSAGFEIPNSRACWSQQFSLTDNGRIAGRLLNFKGDPPSGLNVEVVTAGNIPVPRGLFPLTATVADDGSFEAGELPPGDYIVGVNLRDLPNPGVPYARVLYPRGTSPGTGMVTVKAGERVDLGTWQLPGSAPAAVVSGVVVWEDERPAANIEIRALDVTGERESNYQAGRAITEADGAFAIGLWRGHRYRFVATSTQTELMLVAAPALELGDGPPPPLRIVIRAPK
jgi:hypothetical protein